jgi:hypothetical protein
MAATSRPRALLSLALLAGVPLWGCPQLLEDDFELTPAGTGSADGGSAGASAFGGSASGSASGGAPRGSTGSGSGGAFGSGGSADGACAVPVFLEPRPLTSIGRSEDLFGPSLSGDGLTLYFSARGAGREHIYQAVRTSVSGNFEGARLLEEVDSDLEDGTPFVRADGLALYLFSSRPGGMGGRDLWLATRPEPAGSFAEPIAMQNVNASGHESSPATSRDALTLFFTSDRDGGDSDIWFATRDVPTGPFDDPSPVPNIATSSNEEGPALSADGLTLYFATDRSDSGMDIWTASRATADGTFGGAESVPEVSSSAADVDPAISRDGSELFFSSNRGGSYQIWRAALGCASGA